MPPLTPQERFAAAFVLGMKASPFSTTQAAPLVLIRGTTRISLKGCSILYKCSSAPFEETGIRPGHILDLHIPKSLVSTMPDHELDAFEYQGRRYKFQPASGTEPHSPVWVIHATSPLQ